MVTKLEHVLATKNVLVFQEMKLVLVHVINNVLVILDTKLENVLVTMNVLV